MSWRIDAWAVRDGVAFASEREDLLEKERLEARNTVFLSVPDLEPVPVGRISTALRATRGNFQAGFLDGEGNEIVLPNLADVRELVRRAYLASGIGDGGAAAPLLPDSPSPEEGGAAEIVSPEPPSTNFLELAIDRLDDLLEVDPLSIPEARRELAELEDEGWSELAGLIRGYALDVSLAWERRVASYPDDTDADLLASWYFRLAQRGLWDDCTFESLIDLELFPAGQSMLALLSGIRSKFRITPGFATRPAGDVLRHAPAPLLASWHSGIRRLTDKLYLALSAGDYFHYHPLIPDVVPSLLATFALTGGNSSALISPGRLHRNLRSAVSWLWTELPGALPPAAEEAISNYAWQQLDRPAPTTSGPSTLEPEGSARPYQRSQETWEEPEPEVEGSAGVANGLRTQRRLFFAG